MTVAPALDVVSAWRPEDLLDQADQLMGRASTVEDHASAVRRGLADALDDAGGAWATTAQQRAEQEGRRGAALAGALVSAARALRVGAAGLGAAREVLVAAVERARAAGFAVTDDGQVVPLAPEPAAPRGLGGPERLAWSVAPQQVAAREVAEHQRATHQAEVQAALAGVAEADRSLADALAAVAVPETLPSVLAAHQARTTLLGDRVAALGAVGGAVVVGKAANDARSLRTGTRRLRTYASLVRTGAPAAVVEESRRAFAFGTATRPVLKVVGRVSLPSTVLSGFTDAATGGGHDGVRGWATRGFGTAGSVGAAAVLAGTALGPGAVVVGGAAVLAYGAWTAGSHVVDHWDQVEDAGDAAGDWLGAQGEEAAGEVAEAVEWAHDRLAAAAADGVDALGELF